MKEISSKSNPLIKLVKSLGEKKFRRQTGLFLLEGQRILETCREVKFPLKYLFYAEDFKQASWLKTIFRLAEEVFELPRPLLDYISEVSHSQGVLGVAEIPPELDPEKEEANEIYLLLENISDPGNLGAVLRVAWAGGARLILAGDCVDLYEPKVIRSSAGGILKVPVFKFATAKIALEFLKGKKIKIYATTPHEGKPYNQISFAPPLALCFGSEAHGLSDDFLAAGEKILIPLEPGAESLNLAVSSGILLYAAKAALRSSEERGK